MGGVQLRPQGVGVAHGLHRPAGGRLRVEAPGFQGGGVILQVGGQLVGHRPPGRLPADHQAHLFTELGKQGGHGNTSFHRASGS